MEDIIGYMIKNERFSHWESLIEEWHLAINRYCRITKNENDAPYWYNERANIGVLAGAAWRCGRVALEEFQNEKGNKSKKWVGRADLWIGYENGQEIIEAKFKWLSLRSHDPVNIAKSQLHLAHDDAISSRGSDASLLAIAVSFLPTYVPKKYYDDLEGLVNNLLKEMQHMDCGLIAWIFPKVMQEYVTENGNVCPGVILVANIIN